MTANNPSQSFSANEFLEALDQHNYEFTVGQIISGKIISHARDGVYVDVGGKSPAFLPADEAMLESNTDLVTSLPLDSEHEFLIISEQNAEGEVKLSIRRMLIKKAWQQVQTYQAEETIFDCVVLHTNKGGVVVNAVGLRGFIPRSHLTVKDNLESLIGKTMSVSVIEINEPTNRLVLSNTNAVRTSVMGNLAKGQLVAGTVSGIRPFGVFLNFDGVSGLLHIKEISQARVNDINAVFAIGDPVPAVIIDIDESRNRISLSTKLLENHAGELLENTAQVFAEAPERLEKNIQKLWNT